jgi:hypothetical protein
MQSMDQAGESSQSDETGGLLASINIDDLGTDQKLLAALAVVGGLYYYTQEVN